MLQPQTTYSDTNKIAHDAYKICETLGRAFKVYKNESSKYIIWCRDCGAASCFSIRDTASIINGVDAWKITTSNLTFNCSNLGKPNRQYSIKQLMGWGVIPTAAAYIPTSAGGNKSGGQIKQLGTMLQTTDKIRLKKTQLAKIIDQKKADTSDHMVQQYGLLQSYLELDMEEESGKNQRILSKGYSDFEPMSGAYVLDTQWNKFRKGGNIELPVLEQLLYTTGYSKAYWHSENIWRHCELDMCHGKGIFGGRISLLTHATGNGKN